MIANELLTYVTYCVNSSAADNCKAQVEAFYNTNEIICPKRTLWLECSAELNVRYHNRKSTANRTTATAYIKDIFEAITYLDSKGKVPEVVARDISRLPDRQPDELNMLSVVNRVLKNEKSNDARDEVVTSIQIEVLKLQDEIKSLKNQVENKDPNTNIVTTPIASEGEQNK